MMIEGSCIDDGLHENNLEKAMEELLDFDRTLGDVLEWAALDGHTLVIVTADHSTGAITLQDGDLEEGRIGVAFDSAYLRPPFPSPRATPVALRKLSYGTNAPDW